jgi:ATP-dependent helicase/nuclease subunit B
MEGAMGVTPGEGEMRAVADALHRLRGGDLLGGATVAVPGPVPKLQVRRALGAMGGVAGIDVVALREVAERLAGPLPASHDGVAGAWEEATRLELAASPGPFKGVERHPATVAKVAATLRRLRVAEPEERSALAARSRRSAHLVALLGAVERRGPWRHTIDIVRAAVAALEAGADPGPLVIVRPRTADPVEARLVRALTAHAAEVVARADDIDAVPDRLLVAADAETEARLAVQAVVSALGEGTPGHAIAVLPLGDANARRRLAQLLDAAGLTLNGPSAGTLASSAAARALLGLLRLDDDGWSYGGVLAALGAAPLRHPLHGGPLPLDRWTSIARAARVVAGVAQWTTRPRRHAASLRHHRGDDGLLAAAEADDLADATAELARLVHAEAATWTERAAAAVGLLDAVTDPEAWPDAAAQDHAAVRAAVEGVAGLDALGGEPTREAFIAAVEQALERATPRNGRVGRGVHLATLDELVGAAPRLLVITGLVEGAAPARRAEDALRPDDEAREVTSATSRTAARAADRQALAAAIASAHTTLASCHLADAQAARFPSRWLLGWAGRHLGATSPISAEELLGAEEADWLRVVPSFTAAVSGAGAAASEQEVRLASLAMWTASGGVTAEHPTAKADPALARAVARLAALDGSAFGEHHGKVAAGLALDEEVSASALETWATCPRRHLLAQVLRVGETVAPQDTLDVDGGDRGNLAHRVLEAVVGSDLGRAPDEAWDDEHRELAIRVLSERAEELRRDGRLGTGVLADLRLSELASVLLGALEIDDRLRSEEGWVPVAVEQRFGESVDKPVAVGLPSGRVVRFKGRIDRVDSADDGVRVRVVDYKTGRGSQYLAASKGGAATARLLQLGVYEEVARVDHPAAEVEAGWWLLEGRDANRTRREIVANHLDAHRFRRAVDAIADGMAGGIYPADPGDDDFRGPTNCGFCAFDRVCATDRIRQLGRIAEDPALEPWRRLRAIGNEVGAEAEGGGEP